MKQLTPAPIGIDIGSYKSKIAVAKRGGVEIITNDANFR
jgi:molecular chaperone DnaK (HSP70)